MNVYIPAEKMIEISQELDVGMVCYYHRQTGELESLPDESRHPFFEMERWADVIKRVKAHRNKYIPFEPMDGSNSFRKMETFVATIPGDNTRRRFEETITLKRPFQEFKQLLHEYPSLREEWFRFNDQQNVLWVQQQLDAYNISYQSPE